MSSSPKLEIVEVPVSELVPYANNSKEHDDEQVRQIANSIEEFGNCDPIGAWHDEDGRLQIVEGHGRALALKMLGIETAPVIFLDHLTDDQRRAYSHVHNQLTLNSEMDWETLTCEMTELDFDWEALGFADMSDEDDGGFDYEGQRGKLTDRYVTNPFSVLDGRSGEWGKRKEEWRAIIPDDNRRGGARLFGGNLGMPSNSMLDPVLIETLLAWFAPYEGAKVFDCFAGDPQGSIVASYLGYDYTGIELRQEQVDVNLANCRKLDLSPRYICDDGRNVCDHIEAESQDLLISCPPYFDLEVYSDDQRDASNQGSFDDFYAILDEAFSESIKCLKPNRFACVIVTDIRKPDGTYYDFVERVRGTFERNGMGLYNHLILATPLGTSAMRVNKSMVRRKPVRAHQNVLVFLKGNDRAIAEEFRDLGFHACEDE